MSPHPSASFVLARELLLLSCSSQPDQLHDRLHLLLTDPLLWPHLPAQQSLHFLLTTSSQTPPSLLLQHIVRTATELLTKAKMKFEKATEEPGTQIHEVCNKALASLRGDGGG